MMELSKELKNGLEEVKLLSFIIGQKMTWRNHTAKEKSDVCTKISRVIYRKSLEGGGGDRILNFWIKLGIKNYEAHPQLFSIDQSKKCLLTG